MRIENILRIGIKEMRGIMRDKMIMIMIVYDLKMEIYKEEKEMKEKMKNEEIEIVDEEK